MKNRFRFRITGISIAFIFFFWSDVRDFFIYDPSIVQYSQDFPSPDRQWIATLEEVDNGLGFGLGMLYDEIHVRRPNEKISVHGDHGRSVVFYANSDGLRYSKAPQIRWVDSTHILIIYDPKRIGGNAPGKTRRELSGLSIEYQAESLK